MCSSLDTASAWRGTPCVAALAVDRGLSSIEPMKGSPAGQRFWRVLVEYKEEHHGGRSFDQACYGANR